MTLRQFHDVSFPARFLDKAQGGPTFPLTVLYGDSGGEFRRVSASSGLNHYSITPSPISPSEQQELIAFFRAREGGRFGFRFHDRQDHDAQESLLATADGTQHVFPVYKTYHSGDNIVSRRIYLPLSANFRLYTDNIEQPTSSYMLDILQGTITYLTPPAEGTRITASFTFDIPVRFETETLSFHRESPGRTLLDKPLILCEVRA